MLTVALAAVAAEDEFIAGVCVTKTGDAVTVTGGATTTVGVTTTVLAGWMLCA